MKPQALVAGSCLFALILSACLQAPVDDSPLQTFPTLPTTTVVQPASTTTTTAIEPDVVALARDERLSERYRYDVYGPTSGSVVPVTVIIPDIDGRDDVQALAERLAESSVVIVISYDGPTRGGRFPDPVLSAVCGLGVAATADKFGGDPSAVTMVGLGFGALSSFLAIQQADLYRPDDCEIPVLPRRLVAISGTWDPLALADSAPAAMAALMGGSPEDAPGTWNLLDPLPHIATVIPITFVEALLTVETANFLEHLTANGFDIDLVTPRSPTDGAVTVEDAVAAITGG